MYNLMMPGFEPDRLKLKVTAYSIVPHTLLLWSGKRDQIFFKHFIVELSGVEIIHLFRVLVFT